MKKKILVLTGSPRKNGNSDMLADAFIEGASEMGHEVVKYDAGRKKINGCIACQKCFSKGTACVFKDDFNELALLIEDADTLVITTPLYFYSFTAQIKAAIDKLYSFFIGKRPLKIKECLLIACGETDNLQDFEGLIKSYQITADFLEWKNRGELIVTNVNEKGDVLNTDGQERAKKLGLSI